jgi:hypothetical protein
MTVKQIINYALKGLCQEINIFLKAYNAVINRYFLYMR